MKRTAALLLTASLCACASPPPKRSAADQAELDRPLTCESKAECDRFWQRAQVYVQNHSPYRMQTVTDSIISTYGPMSGDLQPAWSVTRLPNASGGAVIRASVQCGNMFGCVPDAWSVLVDFKRFVRAS